jgi:transglutaminase-like putative cysteine protease
VRLFPQIAVTLFLTLTFARSAVGQNAANPAERSLRTEFSYKVHIGAPPAGTKTLALWVPLPSNSEWQQVESVDVNGIPNTKIMQEPRFGNRMVYAHLDKPQTPLDLTVRFTVNRREMRVLAAPPRTSKKLSVSVLAQYLAPETSLPVGGRFLTISQAAVAGKTTQMEKVRALYEHVVATMQYDYKAESPQFGKGDADFVCDYKRGDCTDLHSYLISLLRTQKIPVVHEYGLPVGGLPVPNPLPQDDKITSYHCYVCVYDPDYGWFPVDASDAIRWIDHKRPDMKDYEFGNQVLERNAVVMSRGRNIVLSPPQQSAPVNKFIYPYAEADGKPIQVDLDLTRHLLTPKSAEAGASPPTGAAAPNTPSSVTPGAAPSAMPDTNAPTPQPVQNPAGAAQPPAQDLQSQIDELRRLVRQQAQEIAALRDQGRPAPPTANDNKPVTPTAPPKDSAPPTSPVVRSGERLNIYGFLRVDAMRDSSLTNNTQSPLYVLSPANTNKGSNSNGALAIHPRLSRLGLDLIAPPETSSGWKVGGKLEVDWQNGSGLTAESRPLPRIRLAYFQLQRGSGTLLFGQTWDLISPLNPSVNDDTLMWNAGNIGDRRVQIRYTYEPKSSPFSVGTALGLTGAIDAQDLDNNGVRDGEDASLPNVQLRGAWKGKSTTLGLWTHYAWETTTKAVAGHHHFTSYSVGLDAQQRLNSRLGLSGELWAGQNLSDFRGGIGQGVIAATGTQVRSHGGWVELGYQVSPKYKAFLGYTAEAPESDDIPAGGRLSNGAIYLHNRYRLTNNVDLGASYLYWTTRWQGQSMGVDHRIQTFVQHNF